MIVGSGISYGFRENSWFGVGSGLVLENFFLLKN